MMMNIWIWFLVKVPSTSLILHIFIGNSQLSSPHNYKPGLKLRWNTDRDNLKLWRDFTWLQHYSKPPQLSLFDISISNIDCRYIDTLKKISISISIWSFLKISISKFLRQFWKKLISIREVVNKKNTDILRPGWP